MMEYILSWIMQHEYLGIFSLLALGVFGMFIPGEGVLGFGGILVYENQLHFVPVVASAFLGSVTGITATYVLRRTYGKSLLKKYGHIFHVIEDRLNVVQIWFNRLGKWMLLICYFVPGVRHLTAFLAGASKLNFSTFALFTYTGALLWTTTYIYLGYSLGKKWVRLSSSIHHIFIIVLVSIIILLLIYFFLKKRKQRKK